MPESTTPHNLHQAFSAGEPRLRLEVLPYTTGLRTHVMRLVIAGLVLLVMYYTTLVLRTTLLGTLIFTVPPGVFTAYYTYRLACRFAWRLWGRPVRELAIYSYYVLLTTVDGEWHMIPLSWFDPCIIDQKPSETYLRGDVFGVMPVNIEPTKATEHRAGWVVLWLDGFLITLDTSRCRLLEETLNRRFTWCAVPCGLPSRCR